MSTQEVGRCDKLIMAVVQGDDCTETISELNNHGFMVTILSSSGGFLKKKSSTIMIGVEEGKLDQVLALLKQYAGRRKQTVYLNTGSVHGVQAGMMPMTSMEVDVGGATCFVMNMEQFEKY